MLEIPSIGLHQPFFEGVTLTAIDNGPSHWPGTPMPGHLGNVVIAGHRVTKTRPFYDLDLAQPGDELVFTMDSGQRHVYVLDRIEIVAADAVHIVGQSYGYRATLFGCHPKGSKQQRIVGHFTLQQPSA
jgi:sortase A